MKKSKISKEAIFFVGIFFAILLLVMVKVFLF